MNLNLEILARIGGQLTNSTDAGPEQLNLLEQLKIDLLTGSGADQANLVFVDQFSIAASGSQNYDLSGALTDVFGDPAVFSAVKAILLIADAGNTNNVILGNGATPFVGPFGAGTQTVEADPGGVFLVATPSASGWAVTNTSADTLKLANSGSGTAVTGTLVIIGKS